MDGRLSGEKEGRFCGAGRVGEPLDTSRSRRAPALLDSLISMDVPGTEITLVGRRNRRRPRKARARAIAKREVGMEECLVSQVQVIIPTLLTSFLQDGLYQVCKD